MNNKTPNHIGLEIGRVIEVTPKKIKIKLNQPLNQQDAIRFLNSGKGFIANYIYDEKDNLINQATDICYVDNKVNLTEKDIVCKTQDYQLLKELKQLPERKIPITYKVKAIIGENLEITISDGNNIRVEKGSIVSQALNAPMSKERIKHQLEKLGNTPFISKACAINASDNIFISVKEINDIRRNLVEKLENDRQQNKNTYKKNEVMFSIKSNTSNRKQYVACVNSEEKLDVCLKLGLDRVYVENMEIYKKYEENSKVYYKIPRCSRFPSSLEQSRNLVSDYYDFTKSAKEYVADYTFNISNIYTIYYLQKLNMATINLSVELNEIEIQNIINNYERKFNSIPNIELLIYGRIENMLVKGNILNIDCELHKHKLIDFKNRKFPVHFDGTNTHIMNFEVREIINDKILSKLSSVRFDFYDETPEEIKTHLNSLMSVNEAGFIHTTNTKLESCRLHARTKD